ncbi:hypothetical protein ACE1ET_19255 [Saccharicrinis sp. FJH62]|uniref:hypothetical protein n=1 Tax=Saccharicrinis sp. FJH62 TaxID=3344657 RepID=UPI0035D47351
MLQKADINDLQFFNCSARLRIYMTYKPMAAPWAELRFALQAKYFLHPNENHLSDHPPWTRLKRVFREGSKYEACRFEKIQGGS